MNELTAALDNIDQIGNDTWLETLDSRKRAEMEFHNRDRDPQFVEAANKAADTYEKFYGNKKYYNATRRSKEFVDDWIARNARGKVFLDYACGNGKYALHAAKSGADLSLGFDISNVSVVNARRAAAGVPNIRYFQADAENTKLPDNCIDTVICSGMLHHLDLSFAFPELRRILKPGGMILAVEALDYNPAIKFYRMMTPDMRTEWEKAHILSLKDVAFASRFFSVEEVRYWHVLGYAGGKVPALMPLLDAADRLLERVPLINRMAWMFTFCLRKK
ncbi:MAG: methyltransferase domain-containing protein [Gammaproteobacteria bacterium]|jgi:ubiquinone/menaquinone biosynthesis C-methylase UbiE|nr:methyltransferase domain-containing protein [Gammaproteobacteria bacterium]